MRRGNARWPHIRWLSANSKKEHCPSRVNNPRTEYKGVILNGDIGYSVSFRAPKLQTGETHGRICTGLAITPEQIEQLRTKMDIILDKYGITPKQAQIIDTVQEMVKREKDRLAKNGEELSPKAESGLRKVCAESTFNEVCVRYDVDGE